MAKTLPAEAFIDYQDELLQKLPMNDAVFVALLKKNNFFSGNQKAAMQAQCTEVEKAQYFLDDIVGHDIDVLFVKLLSVMEVYGEPITTLAGKIKERIGLISCSRIGKYLTCTKSVRRYVNESRRQAIEIGESIFIF